MSERFKEPNEENCDHEWDLETALHFLYHRDNKRVKTFESGNVYISFYSVGGCSIDVRARFAESQKREKRKKVVKSVLKNENGEDEDEKDLTEP